jgi:hypothetical protein
MDTLAGYIATICVSVAATYLSQFLRPKIKIRYWISHAFLYTMPWNLQQPLPLPQRQAPPQQTLPPTTAIPQEPPTTAVAQPSLATGKVNLLTHTLTVQNFGRKTAEWVEIVHRRRPDFFQLYPSLNYAENTTLAGEHVLRINSVAPREWFAIQFLSYQTMPELLYIRSTAGHASLMPWMVVRKLPQWVYQIMLLLLLVGCGLFAYWLIKAGVFLFKLMSVRVQ